MVDHKSKTISLCNRALQQQKIQNFSMQTNQNTDHRPLSIVMNNTKFN